MSRTLLRSLFSFDPRPTSEVEDEMRAEFDAHLAMLEDELTHQGLDPADAREQALARFGDPTRLSREGKAIKLGDRIMLQRINLALLVVVGAAVVWLLVQNQRINTRNVATLEQVAASLTAIQNQAASPESSPLVGPSSRRVFIEGEVEKPGTYILPARGMSIKELINAAGGLKANAKTVYYDKAGSTDTDRVFATSELEFWRGLSLGVNDIVTVTAEEDPRAPVMIEVQVRGYATNVGKRRVSAMGSNLMTLLGSVGTEAEARSVRLERSMPEPMTKTLPIGEALADVGRNIPLLAGDVITVLGPEGEIPPSKGWNKYEPTARVSKLMGADRDLLSAVEARRNLDVYAQQKLTAGYPMDHRELRALRVQAEYWENQIASRLRELLKPEIAALAEHDPALKQLVQERAQLDEDLAAPRNRGVKPDAGEWENLQRRSEALDLQIMSRFDELSQAEKK